MQTRTDISKPLVISMNATAGMLHFMCRQFIAANAEEISEQDANALLACLDAKDSLFCFNLILRKVLTKMLSTKQGFDSAPWWTMIDAIGFWGDAHPGRWPYTNVVDQVRSLDWAYEFATEALVQTVLH